MFFALEKEVLGTTMSHKPHGCNHLCQSLFCQSIFFWFQSNVPETSTETLVDYLEKQPEFLGSFWIARKRFLGPPWFYLSFIIKFGWKHVQNKYNRKSWKQIFDDIIKLDENDINDIRQHDWFAVFVWDVNEGCQGWGS